MFFLILYGSDFPVNSNFLHNCAAVCGISTQVKLFLCGKFLLQSLGVHTHLTLSQVHKKIELM
jgi:hypothetical protein